MKGIIFNYLEEYITQKHGDEVWETLLEKCPMKSDKIFIGPGSYPDVDFLSILNLTSKTLKQSPDAFLFDFGENMFHYLARDYPNFLKDHNHPKQFLKTVEGIIHVEVRKLFKEATPPRFDYKDPAPEKLIIQYSSKRKMCHLMEGILKGVSIHFKTPIDFQQATCMHRGDETCSFDLTFGDKNV